MTVDDMAKEMSLIDVQETMNGKPTRYWRFGNSGNTCDDVAVRVLTNGRWCTFRGNNRSGWSEHHTELDAMRYLYEKYKDLTRPLPHWSERL